MDAKPDSCRERAIIYLLSGLDRNEQVALDTSPITLLTGSLMHWVALYGNNADFKLLLHYGKMHIEILDSRGNSSIKYALSISD